MKSQLPLILGLSLLAQATVFGAEEAKKPAPDASKVAVKAAAPKVPAQPADVAAPKLGGDGKVNAGFQKQHESFVEIAKKGEAQVVFLGDSITAGWNGQKALFEKEYAQYKAANFGIGGDRTQHVLWRVENGEFEGLKPKVVVLMIGTNNPGRTKNQAVNALIAKLHDGKKVHYLDIGPKFLTADGTLSKDIMPDLLHLNAKGYQIEADAIREKLAELAK